MQSIYLTQSDHQKLRALIKKRISSLGVVTKTDEFLASEIARAKIVDARRMPHDVVTMNSQVRFTDTATGESLTYWLTYPDEANIFENKLSVLSPVGSALIGYRVGDLFEVPTGPTVRTLKIVEVLHQPEMHGIYT